MSTLSEEGYEPGLFEVSVVGQRRGDVPLLHDEKARAVGEAPTLVTSSSVSLHRSPELRVRLRNDFHIGISLKLLDHLRCKAPQVCTPHATRS